MTSPQSATRQPHRKRFRLPRRATPVVFAVYMSAIMAFLMCLVITAANGGMGGDYLHKVWSAYQLAMPVAFLCVLVVRPLVVRLVAWTVVASEA